MREEVSAMQLAEAMILAGCPSTCGTALRSSMPLPAVPHPLLCEVNFGGIIPQFVTGTLGGAVEVLYVSPQGKEF